MPSFLITCPHATCAVPEANRELFKGSEDLVSSTEGWEPGALNLAQGLAMKFSTPIVHGDVTRLLINLDEEGDKRWSPISTKLPEATRSKLAERHDKKYRDIIQARIEEDMKRHDDIIHIIIHTAPIADGKIVMEHASSSLAKSISDNAAKSLPSEVDSRSIPLEERTPIITWLLDTFPSEKYGLIRITVSQSFFMKSVPMRWETIKKSLIQALSTAAAQ